MLMAIEKLQHPRGCGYSVHSLYDATIEKDNCVFHSPQDIIFHESKHAMKIDAMPWPLVPLSTYRAPWRSRAVLAETPNVAIDGHDGVDTGVEVLEVPALPVLLGSSVKANRKEAVIDINSGEKHKPIA